MKNKQLLLGLVVCLLLILSTSIVIAAGKSGGGSASKGILSCRNSVTCVEIDRVWEFLTGLVSRESSVNLGQGEVYDPTTKDSGRWDEFCDVHDTECQGAALSGSSSSGSRKAGFCYASSSSELSSILGAPSISAATIDHILEEAGSPAAGNGKYFVQYGKEYGIDAAFALAFFRQESNYATDPESRADERRSIGNIRCDVESNFRVSLADDKQKTSTGIWCGYESWENSIKGWYNYISKSGLYLRAGKNTVEEILPTYAPSNENDPAVYTANVKQWVSEYREVQEEYCTGKDFDPNYWAWDGGVQSQISEASDELLAMLSCMQEELNPSQGRISSLSDNDGFEFCQNNPGSSKCAHTDSSAHYGCGTYHASLAVDFGNELESCALAKAAKKCGANYILGPVHDRSEGGTHYFTAKDGTVECDELGLWNERKDHWDHLHVSVLAADGSTTCK